MPADGSQGAFGKGAAPQASGGYIIKDVANVAYSYDNRAYLEYTVYSDKDTTVDLWIGAGIASKAQKSALGVSVTADGQTSDYTATEGTLPFESWNTYRRVNYGHISRYRTSLKLKKRGYKSIIE